MDQSEAFDASFAVDEWHYLDFTATVPEGASTVQVGAMLVQPTGDDHGSVYMDDFYMHLPLTTTGLFVTHGTLADAAVENGVTNLTWTWDVWSSDGFEYTPSSSGERTITVDVSEMLGIDGLSLPTEFALHNNYPNPFNPSARIRFDIPEVSRVELSVFDITGGLVETLLNGKMTPGGHEYTWEPKGLSTGVYFLRLTTGNEIFTQKVTYVK